MAFDFSGISSFVLEWLTSFVFWGIALLILLVVSIGSLLIRRRRKLIYPCIELTDLGAGKVGLKKQKAGWFKTQTILFGLFDYGGEDVLKLKDKRQVQNASSEDFHDIEGKRGLIVMRKSDDPAIVVPITRMGASNRYDYSKGFLSRIVGKKKEKIKPDLVPVKNMEVVNLSLLTEIAPADYRDASVKLISNTEKETRGKWEKLAPYLVFGTLAIIFIVCIILIVQMVKQGQTEAKDLILQAGRVALEGGSNIAPASGGAP